MTTDSIKNKRLVGLFLLGCTLFNYPILNLFNLDHLLFRLPLIYFYMFAVWTFLILAIVFVTNIRPSAPNYTSRKTRTRGR